jgi:hypothetical protein
VIVPGQVIPLREADSLFLGRKLSEMVSELESQHSQLFQDIRVWWSWYDATPRLRQKDFPFVNASNLVVPLIQVMSDALVNRLYGMVFGAGNRIWMGRTENVEMEQHVRDVVRWINWAANDNDFNFRGVIYDWLSELVPIGSSVLALNWREDVRWAWARNKANKRGVEARQVRYASGPLFEHVPREQILWDTTMSVGEAPIVVRELHKTWSELNHLAHSNGWDLDALEAVQHEHGLTGPSQQVRKAKRQEDSVQPSLTELGEPHDVREVHVDWPLLQSLGFEEMALPNKEASGQPSIPLVGVLHRKTERLLQLKAEPYFFPSKPFFDGFFKKRSGRGHSVGLAKKLEHMQSAMTTLLNQAIDARTRANSVWAKTSQRSLLTKPLDPRHPVHVPEGAVFEPFNLPTNVLQDTTIFNVVNIVAERLTGQADPNFGRESRSGGHPSPATSTLALLEQSDQMVGTTRELLRQQLSRMGEAVASLYQQFMTDEDGRLQRVLGPEDGNRVAQYMFPTEPVVGLMEFDVTSMNESMNPQAEVNKQIQLSQMNVNYWAFVMQAMQAATQATQAGIPEIAQMAVQSVRAQTKFQERLLAAGDVDDVDQFILNLQAAGRDLQAAAAGPGQVGAGAGNVPQPGVGGPAGANGSGTLVAPGGFGLQ